VFPDMSRKTPFAARAAARLPLPVPGGLAEMRSDEGPLITCASGPDQPAQDGPKSGHSPFTQALFEHIAQPAVEIQQAMTEVRAQVHALTYGQQLAWGNSNLVGTVYLNPQPKAPSGK